MCSKSYDGITDEVINVRHHVDSGRNVPLSITRSNSSEGGVESCLSEKTELVTRALTRASASYTFFVRSATQGGDRMIPDSGAEYRVNAVEENDRTCAVSTCFRWTYSPSFDNFYVNNSSNEWHAQSYATSRLQRRIKVDVKAEVFQLCVGMDIVN
ncbi:hypothetical protein DD237_002540 [Peronospora effusa]|uniref:Uncharacterized protein n=1 Tax=Peronospora effusa TaxID=542832 RepID=A0A3R7XZ33_9STRA|nr:hypothetical protein DD237_002540 [Peronospora effusa]